MLPAPSGAGEVGPWVPACRWLSALVAVEQPRTARKWPELGALLSPAWAADLFVAKQLGQPVLLHSHN